MLLIASISLLTKVLAQLPPLTCGKKSVALQGHTVRLVNDNKTQQVLLYEVVDYVGPGNVVHAAATIAPVITAAPEGLR